MDDQELLRYSRQILLPGIDVAGQERLLASRVLILGLGGLGSPVAQYLAAAGIGELWLADGDRVDWSNLQRQIVHDEAHVGMNKAESAALRLRALNPAVRLRLLPTFADADTLPAWVAAVDLVLDCTDNFASRFAVNAACRAAGKPLISAAAIRFEGQVYTFDPRLADSPCYACLYPPHLADSGEDTCSRSGILGPMVGLLGSLQALEAVKLLAGLGSALAGQVLMVDGLTQEWRRMRLPKDPACAVCGSRQASTDQKARYP
ncbi:MAG: HesA/MoeB/ThiF family protein [Pseudomonadota bacterium]